jgi:hypothetical protein
LVKVNRRENETTHKLEEMHEVVFLGVVPERSCVYKGLDLVHLLKHRKQLRLAPTPVDERLALCLNVAELAATFQFGLDDDTVIRVINKTDLLQRLAKHYAVDVGDICITKVYRLTVEGESTTNISKEDFYFSPSQPLTVGDCIAIDFHKKKNESTLPPPPPPEQQKNEPEKKIEEFPPFNPRRRYEDYMGKPFNKCNVNELSQRQNWTVNYHTFSSEGMGFQSTLTIGSRYGKLECNGHLASTRKEAELMAARRFMTIWSDPVFRIMNIQQRFEFFMQHVPKPLE